MMLTDRSVFNICSSLVDFRHCSRYDSETMLWGLIHKEF